MRPVLREIRTTQPSDDETVAGLHAVVMLGSFMHAAPDSEDTAELSVGGLSALTRLPLAAVAWYEHAADGPLRLVVRCAGERGGRPSIEGAVRELCAGLPVLRPARLDDNELPTVLRLSGIQVLLALPLRVSTECLGFLLVGGRHGSIPSDLTLIQALGAQTSTALYVSRLQESEAARLSELAHLAAELREQGELLSRALRLQEDLIDLVLRGKNAGMIVEHLAGQIGAPVWLLDGERQVIAHAPGDSGRSRQLPRESELRRVLGPQHPDSDPRTVAMATGRGVQPFLVQTVATDRDTFGYLLVGSTALGPVDHTTFQCGRLVLALRMLIERSVADAEERAGRDLLQDVLLRRGGALTSAALAARLGYEDDGPATVLVIRPRPRTSGGGRAESARRKAVAAVRDALRETRRALVGTIGADTVAIVRPDAAEPFAARVRQRLHAVAAELRVATGISDPRPDLTDLAAAHREALMAVALAEDGQSDIVRFADLGLHRLLFDVEHADRVEDHVDRWIGPLVRYDADHRACLVATLTEFLAGGGQRECADTLSIHPSTLKYRLRRIREILGVDFTKPDVRFNIELALRLNDGLDRIRAVGSPIRGLPD